MLDAIAAFGSGFAASAVSVVLSIGLVETVLPQHIPSDGYQVCYGILYLWGGPAAAIVSE